MRTNKRRLYESIMNDISKIIKKHLNESNNYINKLYNLCNQYCDRYGNSDTVGGVIVGGLCYILNRWNNNGDTCDNNKCKRVNNYIINDVVIRNYIDLTQVSYNNYGNALYKNIEIVLDYLDEHNELYNEPNNGYFTL